MSGGMLPSGSRAADEESYRDAWHSLGACVARCMGDGWELSGYDPTVTMHNTYALARGHSLGSVQIPLRVARAMAATLERADRLSAELDALRAAAAKEPKVSAGLTVYLALERALVSVDDLDDDAAEQLRGMMDGRWAADLTQEERDLLNSRQGDPKEFAGKVNCERGATAQKPDAAP